MKLELVSDDVTQYGAAHVLDILRIVGGQLEAAYALNEWSPADLEALEQKLDFLVDTAMGLSIVVRADRGYGIRPIGDPDLQGYCGPPARNDLGLVSNELTQRATFDV